MLRTALRSLRAHQRRFLLSAVAVALGVAFISGSLMYTESFGSALRKAQLSSAPDTSVSVRPDDEAQRTGGAAPRLDAALLAKLRALDGAAAVRGNAEGRAFVVGRDGELLGQHGGAKGANTVTGPGGEDTRYPLADGHRPRHAHEIALDTRTAEQGGFHPGDRVRVVAHGTVRTERLAGTVTAHDPDLASGGSLTLFDTATARRLFAPTPGTYSDLSLTAAHGVSQAELARRARTVLPHGIRATTRQDLDREALSAPGADQNKTGSLLLTFGAVALLVATFLIANTFTMLSAARAREHALLRAVGAPRRYVLRQVLTEAVLLGIAATAVGHLLGMGVAEALNRFFGATAVPVDTLRLLAPGPLTASVAVGVGVTALSAYVPARRAAAVPPVAAMRTGAPPTSRALTRRNVAGVAVTAAGALLTAASSGSEDFGMLVAAGAVLMLGLIVLTPLIALGAARLVRRPLTALAGIHGTLAVENARRNPRRTAATSAMLMIGVAVVSATTVGLTSAGRAEADEAARTMVSDLRVRPVDYADIDRTTADRIAALPDADAVTAAASASVRLPGDRYLNATAVDPHTVDRVAHLTVRQGSLDRLDHGVALTGSEARRLHLHVGSRVNGKLAGPGSPVRLPVVAIYDGPDDLSPALLPDSAIPAHADRGAYGPGIQSVIVKARPGRTDALRKQIREKLDNPALVVEDRADVARRAVDSLTPVLDLCYAMIGVAVLIGVLGLVNTMAMAVFERVREIGVLRAIGFDRRRIATVVRLESMLISLLGAVLGVAGGAAVGAAAVVGQSTPVTVPWGSLGTFFAVSAAVGVLAAVWPARQAARVPLLRAVRTDTE